MNLRLLLILKVFLAFPQASATPMIEFGSVQEARGVPFDNSSNGFTSDNVQEAIEEVDDKIGVEGVGVTACFSNNGASSNKWLSNTTQNNYSNISPYVVPFPYTLNAITYSNKNSSTDQDVEVWRALEGSGSSATKIVDWSLTDTRTAAKNDYAISGGAGDKLSVYIEDTGENSINVIVCAYLVTTGNTIYDSKENHTGDIER